MTNLIQYYQKTEALKQLEKYFPNFSVAVSPSEIAFLYDWLDAPDGDDSVMADPCGFLLRDTVTGAVVLFSDPEDGTVLCHGIFSEPQGAYDAACDYLSSELHITEFSAVSIPQLSTETVDN